MEQNENKLPKMFLYLKIFGFIALFGGIVSLILAFILTQDFGGMIEPNFALLAIGGFAIVGGIAMLGFGFSPNVAKAKVKATRYVQQETKSDLKTMADTTADVTHEAVKNTVSAIKEGIKDSVYCKHCGKQIDADAKFCKHCGKEQ